MCSSTTRRQLLQHAALGLLPVAGPVMAAQPLSFPRDFGAHGDFKTEWWYLTGSLQTGLPSAQSFGFQITFFRSRVDVASDSTSHFAAKQLVFAHTALTDLGRQQLWHDQRIARVGFGLVDAAADDTHITLRDWTLRRTGAVSQSTYTSHVAARDFTLDLNFKQTQPLLLQGDAGLSRKGPSPAHFSRYYTQPHLAVQGQLQYRNQSLPVQGQAWLDHEWSDALLDKDAVGWDWIGMNLQDGSTLTAFRLRRRDGSTLWSGGSLRMRGQPSHSFADGEVRMTPGRSWLSPATGGRYPVEWQIDLPGARYTVRARLDNQELDSRNSTGSVYWEGLSALHDAQGQVIGSGYLEMTGYVGALVL